jgi:hypothetical protein
LITSLGASVVPVKAGRETFAASVGAGARAVARRGGAGGGVHGATMGDYEGGLELASGRQELAVVEARGAGMRGMARSSLLFLSC